MAVMAGRRRLLVLAGLVIAVAIGVFAYSYARAGGPPPNLGAYRVVPPPLFEGARLSAATGPRSAVWSDGIKRFPRATPVTAVYDQDGKPVLYVWGAEGKLADPAGELAAFWQAFDPLATQMNLPVPPGDTEQAGPLGGNLQCQTAFQLCVWTDYSGIVAVSPQPPGDTALIIVAPAASVTITEQGMAAMTLSFRGLAELSQHLQTHHLPFLLS
jgi:hypothetical protein